jgi:hypothetical protein
MEAETALVVDHRSDEEEVLSEINRFLPRFTFSHEFINEWCRVSMRFGGREQTLEYREIPHNCFRVILDAVSILRPEADIRVYEPTMHSDTHVFIVGTEEYWGRFDREATTERKRILRPVDFLEAAWELNGPTPPERRWWQFWK